MAKLFSNKDMIRNFISSNVVYRRSYRRCFHSKSLDDYNHVRKNTFSLRVTNDDGISRTDEINELVTNFTAPALAKALHEREQTLHICAQLACGENVDVNQLVKILSPYLKTNADKTRVKKNLDFMGTLTKNELTVLQRYLHRIPRQVFQPVEKRASVVIPLCNVNGVGSILFERRSSTVRTYKHQVCFPGGMVDEGVDSTIIETSLREMYEELAIPPEKTDILGILRCDWTEVKSITGIAVTPVVGFIGEVNDLHIEPNQAEVEQYFTVPLKDLLDEKNWIIRDFSAPVFHGGPFTIWGLTAYLLDHFIREVVLRSEVSHTS